MTISDSPQKGIACIGWGSLIPEPRTLPYDGVWRNDGPQLPVEFARESGGTLNEPGENITLVICPGVMPITTYWTLLLVPNLAEARNELGRREYKKATPDWIRDYIGFWDKASATHGGVEADTIAAWAEGKDFAGVVWTSLPPGMKQKRNSVPTINEVLDFLNNLDERNRAVAEKYVRTAPDQTKTPYRHAIEKEMGWYRLEE